MKRIVLAVIVLLLPSLSAQVIPPPPFTFTITVDKGCGGEYFVGDMLTVTWTANAACEITFWEIEPDGFRRKLNTQPVFTGAGTGSKGWTLKDYGYGKRAIYAEAVSPLWGSASDQCEYYVRKKAADIEVKVQDQDGQPISGAKVLLNGTLIASTDSSGVCLISEVGFGEHVIVVQFEGAEQTSRIRIATTQKQYLSFVFTVEKRGTIQIRVYNQKGDPIEGADIYIDGLREGSTSRDGTFTVSVSEGDHLVEARWENAEAKKVVTVVKNQTSFADLTIQVEIHATITVLVRDSKDNAVADANVFLDNIFLGKTDTQGAVEETATPGPHTVRVEKEGYESSTQSVNIVEGDNTVTVVLTAEAPAYGILALLGFLYILMRRHN